jgi:hypothetical protein
VALRISPFQPKKENLKTVTFLNCNGISPESPGRRLIEEIEFSFRLERAYSRMAARKLPNRSAEKPVGVRVLPSQSCNVAPAALAGESHCANALF